MGTNIDDLIAKESPEAQALIAKRSQEIIEEVQSLAEVRKIVGRTQVEVGDELKMHQQNVSKLEQRSDLKISTLKSYIESLGGTLNISADLPDNKTVSLNNAI